MTKRGYVFTSECVNMGHPDKVADQISDAILDAIFAQDPMSRVACETLVTKGLVFVAGEITTNCWVDFNAVIRDTVRDIGYVYEDEGFFYKSLAVINTIHDQSPDIAQGVVRQDDFGAGDQGMMFGYAVRNAYDDSLLPLPMILSRRICNRLAEVRHNGTLPWLRPDGKCQVSVRYEDGQPVGIATILISTQHSEEVADKMKLVREALAEEVVKKVFPAVLLSGVNLADE
ncbi:MAG: S-adenosylmethionine synthetase N-terminal domain-containing protein, partial [Candidatus Brocadiia bacterium]